MKPALVALACLTITACGGRDTATVSPHHAADSNSDAAVGALRAAKFSDARGAASEALARDPRDARAAAVRAIAGYQIAGSELIHSLGAIIDQAERLDFFDHAQGRAMWQTWLGKLEGVSADLAIVAADPQFSLELCIACWEHDWNRDGEIDDGDRRMFEIEFFPDQKRDDTGMPIPTPEALRRPTFRFDVGDAEWALAMVSFQRAFGELVLAYKWSQLDLLLASIMGPRIPVTIPLTDKARVQKARTLILAGLTHAEKTRALYLAETDDDREWVPNPTQKNHPIPLAMDAAIYDSWLAVIGDVRRMLESKEGISMKELGSFTEDDEVATRAPAAFIDLGRLLNEPTDIKLDLSLIKDQAGPAEVETVLRGVLGNGYQTNMKPSPIVGRLRAMKGQIDRGEDTFERKLRYLLWLN